VKALLGAFIGADRPKVIAVFGTTRADVERGVRHAKTSSTDLPIWAWCTEQDGQDPEPVAGCERFICGKAAHKFPRDLRRVWPALTIIGWTGKRGALSLKLLPLTFPPFRAVIFNEAGGFFAARPALVAQHATRRLRDSSVAGTHFLCDWASGAAQWLGAFLGNLFERASGLFFALLALAAQPAGRLSQNAVQRARNKSSSPLHLQKIGACTPEVALPNRGWPRRAVLAVASQSDAEFLVFRRPGEKDDPAPLIAIARETNAFAVAKQSAYSAWRKPVVNKHPFRRLQPDEVSEVFAPFSSLLVVRRTVLLQLGVPRALTYGGALMLLFWKASAAGLRSLVAGHAGIVTDEQAMALEDAELALRLTLSPALARLAAARPARVRGNLAWSPFHSQGWRGKPRVLVVSPYLPFPLSHGGAVRIYNLCRSMAGRIDFVLACFHEAGEAIHYDELHEVFREVYVVDVDEKHSDASVPAQIAEYRNAAMSDLIRSLCLEHAVDLVQLEYTQMAEYREHTGGVPVILVEHDITFTLYSQLADFNGDPQTRKDFHRWRDFERSALQCSDVVWTMSEDERGVALEHGAPRNRTRVIPNGVDIRRFTPMPKPAGPATILFVGSFRHLPNLLAFEALRSLIMPDVWRECPDAVLHVIAGPNHEKAAGLAGKSELLAAHPGLVIEGFVSDVRPAYCAADVVAVSLPLSAGTNIKLLEAMACGRAIVSTAAGCRGLGLTTGQELLVAELDASFSTAVIALLRDEKLRMRIAAQARHAAERRFGWHAIAEEALTSYAELSLGSIEAAVRQAI
jgi:glycosyltransferase involved in cell wall biosynthesis